MISIALFGEDNSKYGQYLPAFVRAHCNLFPLADWQLRVHIDPIVAASRFGRLLYALEEASLVSVRLMPPAPLTQAMLWRMAPIFDALPPEYVFPRDLDACPMPRDRAVCDQFIASGCTVHTVHDNTAHAGIMGGLCGFHSSAFMESTGISSLDDLCAFGNSPEWGTHGTDQIVLNRLIDRVGGPRMLEHRFNGWTEGRPGTGARIAGHYACEAFSAPLPDAGVSALSPSLQSHADRLANHLGSAGYDHKAAVAFWDEHGRRDIAEIVKACEEKARG